MQARREAADRRRGSSTARGYGRQWRKLRDTKLAADPVCEACQEALANEVDHRTPKAAGGTDAWSNLQSLCKPCHSAKTLRESVPRGRGAGGQRDR